MDIVIGTSVLVGALNPAATWHSQAAALIALACRQHQVPAIASFDADFDQIPWLHRLSHPTEPPTHNH